MIHISYPLTKKSPLYPNSMPFSIQPIKSIENGDSSNTSSITFSNHSGTHIDVPLHFCHNAESVSELLSPEKIFYPTYCLDIPLITQSILQPSALKNYLLNITDAEALLIRTGMSFFRNSQIYTSEYPRIDPELPDFLRQYLPNLKLFGIDTISISNPSFRELGRACHRNFLCKQPRIMIMEDLNLSSNQLVNQPWLMRIYPWILEKIDAVPVIATLEKISIEK